MKLYLSIYCAVIAIVANCFSQSFINLNFESTVIVTNGAPQFGVVASDAIPGWTAFLSGVPQTYIIYNQVPGSDAAVTLQRTNNNSSYPPIQGAYFVMLWGQYNPGNYPDYFTNTAAIGQTGQIPLSAQSLIFWGAIGGMQATFNGQPLNFLVTGSAANYTVYSADISAYAGETGQLLFTATYYAPLVGGPAIIDNIQFSTSPVPEPSTFALGALGGLLLGFRCWHGQKESDVHPKA